MGGRRWGNATGDGGVEYRLSPKKIMFLVNSSNRYKTTLENLKKIISHVGLGNMKNIGLIINHLRQTFLSRM